MKLISKSVNSHGNKQKAESGRPNDIGTQTLLPPVPTTDSLYPDVEW